jgi:hypothetical protein
MPRCVSRPTRVERADADDPITWPSIVAAIEAYAETQPPEFAADLWEWANFVAALAQLQAGDDD